MLTRRQTKWVCTVACAATALILVASIWCCAGFQYNRFGCGFFAGEGYAWWWEYSDWDGDKESYREFDILEPTLRLSLPSLRREDDWWHGPTRETCPPLSGRRWVWVLSVPLWLVLVVLALPTAFLWWRDRRCIREGFCRKCGYDLTGNVSGRCPECGTEINSSPPQV